MTVSPERIERPSVTDLDGILGQPFKVLDDGFVRLVDYMGDDGAIVQAARVSYGQGTKRLQDDRNLIRYLMRHGHTTPFEMCELKLHVRAPMDAWRQWIRHRTANVNEYSTRYSIAIDAAQHTAPTAWRTQSPTSRQGSDMLLPAAQGALLTAEETELQSHARAVYEQRLQAGVAREQARKDLPLSTYTEAYWKIDLHNLFHFLQLRMAEHAQLEIREYANTIGQEIVRRWCPIAWEAFIEYRVNALALSETEVTILAAIGAGDQRRVIAIAAAKGWCDPHGQVVGRNRERSECEAKLSRLGLQTPWTAKTI
jgi:thymidylate synthase (FAD)